ncbi:MULTISPECIES: HEAT repeat domain-containing protein [unclassified Sphingobacterium]|uniref:HEAT repeat domain-containing protein n=1 Tax=unclassified Sphingobacterium TaxID=2609468 RepID=UPI001AEB0D6E|nr:MULTISPECIES: HEAT repeat domain-containing protein [unclassified Sphingobacterium]MDR6733730.1 phosphate/sulfate permease [Sphingobacterium sp. 2149]
MTVDQTFIAVIQGIVVTSFIGTFVAYAVIMILRFRTAKAQRRQDKLDQLIEDRILPQFIQEMGTESVQVSIDQSVLDELALMDKGNRQTLIDTLIRLRWHVAGTNALMLHRIYVLLGLNLDSLQKMKSRKWYRNVQGLHELTLMDYAISDIDILRFNLSEVSELRSAARSAFMRFSKNEPFRFFDEVRDPLSIWELIGFFRILEQSRDTVKSNFANWIRYSRNKTVVICCMKLAAHEQSVEAIDSIEGLLNVNDHSLRSHAINALGHLRAVHTQEILIKMYPNQPVDCQCEILFSLGMFRTPRAMEFLTEQFQSAFDFEIENHVAAILARLVRNNQLVWNPLNLPSRKQRILNYYLHEQ